MNLDNEEFWISEGGYRCCYGLVHHYTSLTYAMVHHYTSLKYTHHCCTHKNCSFWILFINMLEGSRSKNSQIIPIPLDFQLRLKSHSNIRSSKLGSHLTPFLMIWWPDTPTTPGISFQELLWKGATCKFLSHWFPSSPNNTMFIKE